MLLICWISSPRSKKSKHLQATETTIHLCRHRRCNQLYQLPSSPPNINNARAYSIPGAENAAVETNFLAEVKVVNLYLTH